MATITESSPAPPRPRRRTTRVLATLFGVVLLGLGLVVLAWTVGRSTDTRTETFAGPIERLVIDVNGRVTLDAGETTQVSVVREWLFTGAPDVEMSEENGTLRVTADCGVFQWRCLTHVTATAPAGAEVLVETAAGEVLVTGFQAGVDLASSAGDLIVSGISGPATLRSSAGRIEGDVTDGDVDAQTSAGRIDLDVGGSFSRISAVTSAGSVFLTVPDDVYRVEAETSAGDVDTNVATDPDAARQIFARSSAGNVTIERSTG